MTEPIERKRFPMKLSATIIAVILSVLVYSIKYNNGSEAQSFRGIEWGEKMQDLAGFTLIAQEGDLKFYVRADDRMKLGDVPLEKIIYGFHKDRFYTVMMYYGSEEGFTRSREVLARQYGEPYQPAPSEKKLYWDDNNLSVLLTYDEASKTGRVSYVFKPIDGEIGGASPPRPQAVGS